MAAAFHTGLAFPIKPVSHNREKLTFYLTLSSGSTLIKSLFMFSFVVQQVASWNIHSQKAVIIFFKMTGHVSLKWVCLIQLFVTHLNLYTGVFEWGLTFWPIILQIHFFEDSPYPKLY